MTRRPATRKNQRCRTRIWDSAWGVKSGRASSASISTVSWFRVFFWGFKTHQSLSVQWGLFSHMPSFTWVSSELNSCSPHSWRSTQPCPLAPCPQRTLGSAPLWLADAISHQALISLSYLQSQVILSSTTKLRNVVQTNTFGTVFNFLLYVYSLASCINQVSKSMTLIWYARMVAAMTKTMMAHGRQGFSRNLNSGVGWFELGWSKDASSSTLGWSRGASSSTTIAQLDKYSFGYLYLAVSWENFLVNQKYFLANVSQPITRVALHRVKWVTTRNICQRCSLGIWGQRNSHTCLVPHLSLVDTHILPDCQSIIFAALLILLYFPPFIKESQKT